MVYISSRFSRSILRSTTYNNVLFIGVSWMKNKPLFFLFLYLTLINIVDFITANFSLGAEGNPIYLFLGNMWIVGLIKILILYGLWYYYKKNVFPTNFVYYQFVLIGLLGSVITTIGVYTNIVGLLNPQLVAQAAALPEAQKAKEYSLAIFVLYIIPAILSLGSFILYEKSRGNVAVLKEDGKLY